MTTAARFEFGIGQILATTAMSHLPFLTEIRPLLALALGVDELRVGHELRGLKSGDKRELLLGSCWDMTFHPNFGGPGTVAVASTYLWNDDDTHPFYRHHAILWVDHQFHSITIPHDPVLELAVTIPLLAVPDFRQWRDGHGVAFHVNTTSLEMFLRFDNHDSRIATTAGRRFRTRFRTCERLEQSETEELHIGIQAVPEKTIEPCAFISNR